MYFIFVFEISLQFPLITKKNQNNKSKLFKLNSKVKQAKKNNSFSILTPSKDPQLNKQVSSYGNAEIQKEKDKLFKEVVPISLLNLMKIGVILINQDFDIIFRNDILFELFETENLEEAKIKFFELEENLEIAQNDTGLIPDIEIHDLLKQTLLFPESFTSLKIDEISETKKCLKIISQENLPQYRFEPYFSSNDDLDIQFKNWKKKKLSKNLEKQKNFEVDKKLSEPKSVQNYVEKIFDRLKQEQNENNYIPRSDSLRKNDKKKYSMYVNYKSAQEGKNFVLNLNFILIEKRFDSNSHYEVLITIRKQSELEAKFIEESKSKHKMLGSFCHELRTPINGIINMLDLLQSQNEEVKQLSEPIDSVFDDLLSSAVISSHLLLNEIDDFIDYFSHQNEILEPHLSPFDFQAFFLEISRIFSCIAKKKGLDLFIDLDPNIPSIIFNDQQRLRQILYNLLTRKKNSLISTLIQYSKNLRFLAIFGFCKVISEKIIDLIFLQLKLYLENNSLRFTNSGFLKISAILKNDQSIRISVLDSGTGIKPEDLNYLGSLNTNVSDRKISTCGFGLFMSNLFSLIIEGGNSDKKKGLTVYSEYGTGTCFCFYLNCGEISEKFGNFRKFSSESDFPMKTNKKSTKISSEEKFFFGSSKDGMITSSLFSESEGGKNINIIERNSFQKMREKKNLKLIIPGNEDVISNRSIFFKKQEVEGKRKPVKFFKQGTDNSISLGTIGKMESSLQLKIDNMKCNCIKILVVDDVAFNIEVCRKLLQKLNFASDCAFNGFDAVEKVKKCLASSLINGQKTNMQFQNQSLVSDRMEKKFCEKCKFYKIILMDIDMPIMDGIEATQEILQVLENASLCVSIIGLSAFDQKQIKDKAIRAGMKEYLTKPITFKIMNQILSKYI